MLIPAKKKTVDLPIPGTPIIDLEALFESHGFARGDDKVQPGKIGGGRGELLEWGDPPPSPSFVSPCSILYVRSLSVRFDNPHHQYVCFGFFFFFPPSA